MKSRFTTIDIQTVIAEIQNSDAIGLRLFNVYDIDSKTYLLRLTHGEKKMMLLVESGNRIHLTEYDWPKNMMPSGFSMKCRKHLKGRRLASIKQLGVDRIIDLTFGYDEAAYHLIVELYDRGNIILTDYTYQVLQLLRNRTDADKDVKFAVREIYPIELARKHEGLPDKDKLKEMLANCKPGDNLKRILNPLFIFGPALLEHSLLEAGLSPHAKMNQQFKCDNDEDIEKLMMALQNAENIMNCPDKQGYIIQKNESLVKKNDPITSDLLVFVEFHPYLFTQHKKSPNLQFPTFNKCVDEFFSKLEGQKFETNALRLEKAAIKRLENVKLDHENRIKSLQEIQDDDTRKAELIEMNLPLVEQVIATINSAIANQIDWKEIEEIVKEAKSQNDPVAMTIKSLKLDTNQVLLSLREPYMEYFHSSEDESDDNDEQEKKEKSKGKDKPINVLIDLDQTAFANARSLHNKRRQAASKEQKTMQASKKALKSAEQKTKETLKEVQTSKLISKTRKTYWFEKFFWFISSENYLVIGGRDQQQNELVVKRYLKPGDLYVHADLHGASSVILKNPSGGEVPPKTLNEAGTMAICYSAAWEARVVTSAWWVYHNQVSKTAPSGEYLTTGSFMIRGKKNFLPPSYLIMGFSIMFKLDESSFHNHINDRKVRTLEIESKEQREIENKKEEEEVIEEEEELLIESDDNEELDDKDNVEKDTDPIPLSPENTSSEHNDITEQAELNTLNSNSSQDVKSLQNNLNELNIEQKSIETLSSQISEKANEEDESLFPDTNIQLQHVSGGTFQLHRGLSTASNRYDEDEDEDFIYFGDGEKIQVTKQEPVTRKPRLSAKQRRDIKKKNNQQSPIKEEEQEEKQEEDDNKENSNKQDNKPTKKSKSLSEPKESQQPQQQRKRGQKSKQKRMKEKYGDQDDEDRELMKQILRADEPEKPPKKKGKQKQQHIKQVQQQQKKPKAIIEQAEILHQPNGQPVLENPVNDADNDQEDTNEDFDKENITILDSLTGCPVEDDILMYGIPVCAPYACLQNYKYKVKLTPGTGKRGRGAKTAIGMFQTSKDATDWERDLLKALKDVDISRNIPGKVKVSAPNLQRAKKKK